MSMAGNVKTGAPPSVSKRWRGALLFVLALSLLVASFYMTSMKGNEVIVVTFPSGKELETEVADTPEKLLFGLAFRDELPLDSGMLYIFETSDRHRLRTTGFKVPVDMIWVNERRVVVHVVERAAPCSGEPCPLYGPPPEDARYIIQTVAGFVHEERVAPGVELRFTLRL